MKLTYLSSPYNGQEDHRKQATIHNCIQLFEMGHLPISPHLYLSQFLDYAIPEHKAAADAAALELLRRSSLVVVSDHHIVTDEMEQELLLARKPPQEPHNIKRADYRLSNRETAALSWQWEGVRPREIGIPDTGSRWGAVGAGAAAEHCRSLFYMGYLPIAPYLYLSQFFNLDVPYQQRKAEGIALSLLKASDFMVIGTPASVEAVQEDLKQARFLGLDATDMKGLITSHNLTNLAERRQRRETVDRGISVLG